MNITKSLNCELRKHQDVKVRLTDNGETASIEQGDSNLIWISVDEVEQFAEALLAWAKEMSA